MLVLQPKMIVLDTLLQELKGQLETKVRRGIDHSLNRSLWNLPHHKLSSLNNLNQGMEVEKLLKFLQIKMLSQEVEIKCQ